jgi:methyl-accepting chemotaxis protein
MNNINAMFIFLMLLLVIAGIINKKDFKNEIISIGVLGTFVGILIALNNFDVSDIEKSLPQILEGMKIAFVTSVAGMGLSILLSIIYKLNSKKELNYLEQMLRNQQQIIEQHNKEIEILQNFTSNNTDEFVKGLSKLIENFNSDMVEQFGENFAKLDKSVEKMVVWQENYKKQLELLEEEIKKLTSSYNQLTENSANIVKQMQESVDVIKESLSLNIRRANERF